MNIRYSALVLLLGFAGTAAIFAAGSAGGGQDDETVTLRLYTQYTDDSETVPADYAVGAMKTIMPNVEVEIEIAARDDNQKIKTYAAAGGLPDIFVADNEVIETFRRSNNILPLNDYVDELGIEALLSPARQQLLYNEDGNIYAIPTVGTWVALMYYNKPVFERYGVDIPRSYPEFLQAVRTFAANDMIPLSLFAKEKWPGVQFFDLLATRFTPEGVAALDRAEALASDEPYALAVTRLEELLDAGLIVPGAFTTGYDQAYAQFVEGKAAMLMNGAWALTSLYEDMGDDAGLFEGYPLMDAGRENEVRWVMSGGAAPGGFGVSPYSDHKETAALYAIQLALKFAEGGTLKKGFPPVVADSPEPEGGYNPLQRAFWSTAGKIESTTIFPWGFTNPIIKTNIEDNVQKLMADTMTGDEFIAAMDRVIRGAD